MANPDTGPHPEDIRYEFESEDAGELTDIRGYLVRRRRQGWRLYWIDGKRLHFRRRLLPEDRQAA